MPKPKIENVEPYSELEKLGLEKEVIGIYISGHPLNNFQFELETFCNASCAILSDLNLLEGKDIRVGGIVSSVEHRTTKNGKPFGKFVLEDFSGNSGKDAFTLFGESYLKFRNFMNEGWFLFVEGNVLRSTWGAQNLEFKVRNIELLNDIAQKRLMGVAMRIPVQSISTQFIDALETICKKYPGNAALQVYIKDEFEPVQVESLSRNYRLKAVNDCFQDLKKLAEIGVITESSTVRWLGEEQPKQPEVKEQGIGTISPTFVLEETES